MFIPFSPTQPFNHSAIVMDGSFLARSARLVIRATRVAWLRPGRLARGQPFESYCLLSLLLGLESLSPTTTADSNDYQRHANSTKILVHS